METDEILGLLCHQRFLRDQFRICPNISYERNPVAKLDFANLIVAQTNREIYI